MKFNFGNRNRTLLILAGVVVAAAAGGYYFWGKSAKAEEFVTGKVERGTVRNTVNATGTLQAVTTVQVGSQVSGTISALYADFNSTVKKGQVVAQLDPALFQAQVAQQRANLEQARANFADAQAKVIAAEVSIENLRAGVSSATANLEALKASRDDARSNLKRQESLATAGLINQRDFDIARTTLQSAEARYNQATAQLAQARATEDSAARAGLAQAKASVKQAQAQIQQSEAALKLAEVNLSHATIQSPIDGVVVSRNVDVGQTVAASLQAPTLFTIANDLTQMQVIANIDQADIGVINSSNRISFTVDAFPGQSFSGSIRQIRLNPQNVQNVVTYNVVIDVENPELKLKPGMTANLTVMIAEHTDVLKVPNAALRFRPADVTPEKLRELLRGGGDRPAADAGANAKPDAKPDAGKGDKPAGPGEGRGNRREAGKDATAGKETKGRGTPPATASPSPGGGRPGGGAGAPTSAIVQGQRRVVWVLGPDGKPQPRRIRLGITDGVSSEIAEGDLKEGDLVIVAQNRSSDARPTGSQRPPGFGGAPGGGPGGGGRPR